MKPYACRTSGLSQPGPGRWRGGLRNPFSEAPCVLFCNLLSEIFTSQYTKLVSFKYYTPVDMKPVAD